MDYKRSKIIHHARINITVLIYNKYFIFSSLIYIKNKRNLINIYKNVFLDLHEFFNILSRLSH